MAKVYSPPEGIKVPTFNTDLAIAKATEDTFISELKAFCEANSTCPDKGKEIWFPIADGRARYMVFDYTKLIHLPLGDAYQIGAAHARGLRKADIQLRIKQHQSISELFGRKTDTQEKAASL